MVAANSDADEGRREVELLNGAYAEFLLVPEPIARVNLHRVPDGLAPDVAAMVEPLACCLRGVELAGVEAGQTVAILGAGPIGLMLAACVADAGGWPVVVGGRAARRELVPLFGAETGDGEGADVVIEAAGTRAGVARRDPARARGRDGAPLRRPARPAPRSQSTRRASTTTS